MKITLINKSDLRGGAAVVTYRLMHALRREGVDARMLVVEKLSDDPYVELAASHLRTQIPFLKERLRIFAANRLNRADLFKVDTADSGLPLWRHPLVKQADAVLLNWVNQGMLSLRGVQRIADMGKRVVWTMHDMWCMTGICHHAGDCPGYRSRCGNCPLLGKGASPHDLSYSTWQRKRRLYSSADIRFVAVSNWLAEKCKSSGLLVDQNLSVIPNPFKLPEAMPRTSPSDKCSIVMGAARLDDPVKGFDIALQALQVLKERYPEVANRLTLNTFGGIRDESLLQQIPIAHYHHGTISNPDELNRLYAANDIVLSSSRYETLPGTLIEGQALGCLPVAFDRGGQRDIITNGANGYLVDFGNDEASAASNLADKIAQAAEFLHTTDREALYADMRNSVEQKFSSQAVAQRYIELLEA